MVKRGVVKQALIWALFLTVIPLLLACSENGNDDLTIAEEKSETVQKAPFSPDLADWPHSISNIAPDPRVKFGRLDNGLRYAILPVADDKGTVSIQMHISVGFKDEPEHLYGVAHILEHMAFRGAHKDSEKSMIHDMQSLGAGFGFDLNGFTSNDSTFYRVNLDSAKFDKVSSALQSFSQLVMEPRLTAQYLDIERKVVLSELRQRDSVEARARLERQQFQYPDRKRNKVAGIGTEESLAAISLDEVEGFFKSHYTPRNTILIIAGGVDLTKTENKLAQLFSKWEKGANSSLNHDRQTKSIDLSSFPKVKIYKERGVKTQLNLIENTPSTLQNDTFENQRKHFAERIANAMIKRRLKPRIETQNNVSWINLYKAQSRNYDSQSVTIGAKDYVIASTIFEEERVRAIKYGFSEEELALALKSESAFLKRQNEKPNYINAWAEASRLRNSFNGGKVYQSPAQKLNNFQAFSKSLSLENYHEAAKSLWTNFNPRYWFQSSKTADKTLVKVQENLKRVLPDSISEPVDFESDVFESTDFGTGRIISRDIYSKRKIHRLLYANGTRLNYQNRKTEKDNIQIVVTLKGDFVEFAPRYSSVVEQVSAFSRADIKGVTKSEMDRQFVGQKTSFAVSMIGKNLNISASTRSADLEDTLNIITSFIMGVDIKSNLRKQQFDRKIINIKTASKNSPAVAGALKIPYVYSGKASSFLSKSGGKYSSEEKTLKSIKAIIDFGLIEVGVVGDFDPKVLEGLFSSSLGAIPPRNKVGGTTEKLDVVTHIERGVTNLTYEGDSKQMASFYCWPQNSSENIENEVIETLSAQVINNRIIQRFREELGVTYSPTIVSQKNKAFPDFKYTCFSIQFSPEDEAIVHENFMDVLDELSTKPVTKTELTRAREPIISLINRFGNTNLALAPIIASSYSDPNLLKAHTEFIPLLEKARLKSIRKHISKSHLIDHAHIFRVHSSSSHLDMKRKALEIEVQIGRAEAQYALGNLLKQNSEEGDDARAISLFEKAAAQNYKKAHFTLGRHYALARENFEIAANHLKLSEDSKEGAFLLAEVYFKNPDLFPDISELQIMELYRLSSENGYTYAQRKLAQRYKDGSITDRDEVEALKWAIISTRLRNGAMASLKTKFIERFESNLSEIEKDRARKEADDWTKAYWEKPSK